MTDYPWIVLVHELEECVQELLDQGGAPSKRIIDVTQRARAELWEWRVQKMLNESAQLLD